MKYILYLVLILVCTMILPKQIIALEEDLPDFFICNYWEDTNNDDLLDSDEYVGIKDSYNTETDSLITFVGYFYDQKGKQIGLKLYEPDGTLYSNKTAEVEFEPTHIHRWWYNVKNLANTASGEWTVKWYLEDELQATKTFTISKPTVKDEISSDDDWDWFDDWWYDEEEELPDFFACNKWVDKNKDKIADRNEFIGEKKSFNVADDTTITFVSFWRNQKGKKIEMKIFDPAEKVWFTGKATLKLDSIDVQHWMFNTKKMAGKDKFGKWTAKWYLDDKYHTLIIFNITKL